MVPSRLEDTSSGSSAIWTVYVAAAAEVIGQDSRQCI